MKKTLLFFAILAMSLCVGIGTASAWYFEISNVELDNVFEVSFNPEGTVLVDNYQLDFLYDTSQFTELWSYPDTEQPFVGIYTNTPPSGLYPDFMGELEEGDAYHVKTPGSLRNFNAATMGTGATVDSEISIGTITFSAYTNPPRTDDDVDFGYNFNSLVMKATIDGDSYYLPGSDHIRYGDGNVGNVPIPGTVLLLGSGLLGLIGIHRKRRSG